MELPNRISEQQKFILILTGQYGVITAESLVSKWKTEIGEENLSQSQQSSLARSLLRLDQRDLILRYPKSQTGSPSQVGIPSRYLPENVSTEWITTTLRGEKVAEELQRRVQDERYKLTFSIEIP